MTTLSLLAETTNPLALTTSQWSSVRLKITRLLCKVLTPHQDQKRSREKPCLLSLSLRQSLPLRKARPNQALFQELRNLQRAPQAQAVMTIVQAAVPAWLYATKMNSVRDQRERKSCRSTKLKSRWISWKMRPPRALRLRKGNSSGIRYLHLFRRSHAERQNNFYWYNTTKYEI